MSTPPLLFLYQTRTILRCRRLPSVARSLHVTPSHRRRGDVDIPFASDVPGENLPIEEAQTKGTITPTERQTFDRIFSDIAARGLKPRMEQDLQPPSENARRATNLILEAAAAADAGQEPRGKPISAAQYVTAARDKDKALLRFPPSLRAAASRAFELLNPDHPAAYLPPNPNQAAETNEDDADAVWQTPKNTFMRMIEVDAKRFPEQKRVESMMSLAKTDFELWDIMEKEVFSYPDKLGLRRETLSVKHTGKGKRKGAKKRQAQPVSTTQNSEDAQPALSSTENHFDGDPKLNLYIYGPLYPSFLLFGLRRLDTAFATPSPLALSVLPRIKELGLESFVLGVSTPFYNELLNIYYGRYGDLTNMMDLLEEMRHSGLYFDEGTASILNKAFNQTQALAAGSHGQFAQAFMTMPAYEKSVRDRIKYWHGRVDFSIRQKDVDIDYEQLRRQ